MDQNNTPKNPSENNLSGFDSVSNLNEKSSSQFNPTPMFSNTNQNQQKGGYTVTPQGGFYTPAPQAAEAKPTAYTPPIDPVVPPVAPPKPAEPLAPTQPVKDDTALPGEEAKATEPIAPPESKAEPIKAAPTPQSFIPSGTYSYSAPKYTPTTPQPHSPTKVLPSTPPSPPQSAPKKNKKYGAGIIILSVILAALVGAGSTFGGIILYNHLNPSGNVMSEITLNTGAKDKTNIVIKEESTDPDNITNIIVNEDTASTSIEAVAKKVSPSIVGIRTTAAITDFLGGRQEATGEGSGIIYTNDGYIITNYHVIESAVGTNNVKVEVFLSHDTETAQNATIVGYNASSDLAVVKIEKTGLTPIEFSNSDNLKVGQYAIAIGNPGGIEFMGSVSSGIISGLNRSITMETGNTMSLIQTDAAINPGNSGGALVDIEGKLIGVNTIKLISEGYESMGFAIPSNTAEEICKSIIAKQNDPTPYIGLQISKSYTAEQLKALGYPAGAVVVGVVEGGPASIGGIRGGDIITNFNGTEITGYASLEDAISKCKPNDTVSVKLYRTGRYYATTITIKANNAQ